MTGWVLSYRSKWTHPAFRSLREAGMWAWMCETAVWEDTKIRFNGRIVQLKRGQLVTSLRFMSNGFRVGERVTRTLLDTLQKEGMIDTQTDAHGTIITICNYEEYQQPPELTDTPTNTRPTHARHTPDTNKKQLNNINKINNKDIRSDFEDFWSICPRKIGKGKAEKKYKLARKEISKEELEAAMKTHAKEMKGKDSQYIPHPATWLHQKRYLDETTVSIIEQEKKDWPKWKTKIAAHLGDHVVKGFFNTANLVDNSLIFSSRFEFDKVKNFHEITLKSMGIKEITLATPE